MPDADYLCRRCGATEQHPVEVRPTCSAPCPCGYADCQYGGWCDGIMDRVWGPVRLGRGSSGEPPR